jgi:hypothetical protein
MGGPTLFYRSFRGIDGVSRGGCKALTRNSLVTVMGLAREQPIGEEIFLLSGRIFRSLGWLAVIEIFAAPACLTLAWVGELAVLTTFPHYGYTQQVSHFETSSSWTRHQRWVLLMLNASAVRHKVQPAPPGC